MMRPRSHRTAYAKPEIRTYVFPALGCLSGLAAVPVEEEEGRVFVTG
ncbi:hypothetical protein [Brucella endophytica]